MSFYRALLVEDHPLLQQAIRTFLSQYCDVIGVAGTAEGLCRSIHDLQPDVLVLDVSLPGKSGLHVLPEVRREFVDLGIVIATNHYNPSYRREALERGADAFVLKSRISEELWPAVQMACSGREVYAF